MRKYRRVFVPNPSFRFDPEQLAIIANETIYVCDMPMFDNLVDDEHIHRFEHRVAERLDNFDPSEDIIAYYGDSIIFAMMIMYLSDNFDSFDIARYSAKQQGYVVRELSYAKFTQPVRAA